MEKLDKRSGGDAAQERGEGGKQERGCSEELEGGGQRGGGGGGFKRKREGWRPERGGGRGGRGVDGEMGRRERKSRVERGEDGEEGREEIREKVRCKEEERDIWAVRGGEGRKVEDGEL